jgi:cytochrome P450
MVNEECCMLDDAAADPVPPGGFPEFPTARPHGCPFHAPTGFTQRRDEGPMARLSYADGHHGWLVTGLEAAQEVLLDTRFSSRPEGKRSPVKVPGTELPTDMLPPAMFVNTDPPEHTRYRKLLNGHFTVKRVREWRPRIEELVDGLLDAMVAAGPPADLVEALAKPLPMAVTADLLGLPEAAQPEFARNVETVFSLTSTGDEAVAAMRTLDRMLRELVATARAEQGEDVLGRLAATSDLTDENILGVALNLLIAGLEATTNMIGLGTWALLRHPDQLAEVRADRSLLPRAVEELLRYLSVVQIGPIRFAAADFEFRGLAIRAGEAVTVSLPAANHDPAGFTDADTFDIHRDTTGHVAFGQGPHQCMGHHLARLELTVVWDRLLTRFPDLRLAVADDDIDTRETMVTYGVWRLPVTW